MYSDALYWAMSPITKGRDYHITRLQESVLRKLIHYSKKSKKITYSNEIIGKHTFLKVSTIEKVIPQLVKLGYISKFIHIGEDSGNYYKRRTINIKWDKLAFVLSEIPNEEELGNDKIKEEEVIVKERQINEVSPITQEKTITEVIPIEPTNPQIVVKSGSNGFKLTEEKVNWMIKMNENSENQINREIIEQLTDEELLYVFYSENGVWNIKDDIYENIHLIRIEYRIGTRCKLTNTNIKSDYFHVDQRRFRNILKKNNTEFRYITVEMYQLIKNVEVQRRKLKTA